MRAAGAAIAAKAQAAWAAMPTRQRVGELAGAGVTVGTQVIGVLATSTCLTLAWFSPVDRPYLLGMATCISTAMVRDLYRGDNARKAYAITGGALLGMTALGMIMGYAAGEKGVNRVIQNVALSFGERFTSVAERAAASIAR